MILPRSSSHSMASPRADEKPRLDVNLVSSPHTYFTLAVTRRSSRWELERGYPQGLARLRRVLERLGSSRKSCSRHFSTVTESARPAWHLARALRCETTTFAKTWAPTSCWETPRADTHRPTSQQTPRDVYHEPPAKRRRDPQELEHHRRGIGCISFSQWCCSCQVFCNTCCCLRSGNLSGASARTCRLPLIRTSWWIPLLGSTRRPRTWSRFVDRPFSYVREVSFFQAMFWHFNLLLILASPELGCRALQR